MRSHTRHALWLVMVLVLSGCYRSIGGNLEPTPANVDVTQVMSIPTMPPTFTPLAEAQETEEVAEPTVEQVTELPSPAPSDTPTEAAPPATEMPDQAALPDGQGGPVDSTGPSPTFTVTPGAIALAITDTPPPPTNTEVPPTNTPEPTAIPTEAPVLPTNTPLPTDPPTAMPTLGPTASFTPVPFNRLAPSATYTPFLPPGVAAQVQDAQQPQEAVPLGERPTETLAPAEAAPPEAPADDGLTDGQGGPVFTETPVEIAQVPTATLSAGQATATALVYGATATSAAAQGTILPPLGVTDTAPPAELQPGLDSQAEPVQGDNVLIVTATPATQAGQCDSHLISPGENLYRISQQYGVTVDQIAQANNIVNPDLIRAGDTLVIPCPLPATPAPAGAADGQGGFADTTTTTTAAPGTYIVEPGDNLYRISLRFGVSMTALMQANGMTPATINVLYAGQQLVIPGGTTQQTQVLPTATPQQQDVLPPAEGGVIIITATPFQ